MHRVLFNAKRFWWAVFRQYWDAWDELQFTHARYDFLLVIEHHGEGGITQSNMARALGVSRTAVSKMAQLLEGMKLVRRDHLVDRRSLSLRLTDLGKALFERLRPVVSRPAFLQNLLALCFHERPDPFRAVGDVICDLDALADGFYAPSVEGFVYPGPYREPYFLAVDRLLREGALPRRQRR